MTDAGLAERLATVTASVAEAVVEAGRDASEVTTIVVTKFHPASLVRELAELGMREFGESRHQEAAGKVAELTDLHANWHFIGQLQSKKAKPVRQYASVIHSVDRESLVAPLESDESEIDAFIQVDLGTEPGRGGVLPAELDRLVDAVLAGRGIRLLGLMTVAPLGAPARPAFERLRHLSEQLRKQAPDAAFLSMGMSGDYRDAVLEGATHLRIGTAITGNRPPHP